MLLGKSGRLECCIISYLHRPKPEYTLPFFQKGLNIMIKTKLVLKQIEVLHVWNDNVTKLQMNIVSRCSLQMKCKQDGAYLFRQTLEMRH